MYMTMRGVNARLSEECQARRVGRVEKNVLVRCVEQEDHSDDSVCSSVVSGDSKAGRADSLEDEEQQHAGGGQDEQQPTTETFDSE